MVFRNQIKNGIVTRNAPCGFSKSRHKKMVKKKMVKDISLEDLNNIGYGIGRFFKVLSDGIKRGIDEDDDDILTIPKSIADELEEEIEEAYSSDYIRSYSDVGAYMEAITDGLDEESELYKFMFPDDTLLGCSHRNIIYLYLVDNDLVKVVEEKKEQMSLFK